MSPAIRNLQNHLQALLGRAQELPATDLHRSERGGSFEAFEELGDKPGVRYPAIIRLGSNAWEDFIPFLDYDVEIRKVICSTPQSL
jgi:transposase-like protein